MEICSIPLMFYITGVKAYNRLSISNLVPRVSSLLYLYSGVQEAVRPVTAFCGGKTAAACKIQLKNIFFTYCDHYLQFVFQIRRITSHFILEAAVKVALIFNLGPFGPKETVHIFTLNTLANPRLLFKYLQKG